MSGIFNFLQRLPVLMEPRSFALGLASLRSAVFIILCSGFVIGFAGQVQAKVKANASANEKDNYARIVLSFDRLPVYESQVDDTILVFRFGEEVDLNLLQLTTHLPNYIGVARVDPDGRAFRLAFTDNFTVNIMEAGSKIFIDILGLGWEGLPPNLPQDVVREITRRAAEIEAKNKEAERQIKKSKAIYNVKIRVGVLPTFTRLVFDWNKFVTSKLERQGDKVFLTFGQPVDLDVGRVKHNLPKHLKDIGVKSRDLSTIVTLSLADGTKVRGFREGDDYVVDLSPSDVALSSELRAIAKKQADEDAAAKAGKDGAREAAPGERQVLDGEEVQFASPESEEKKVDEFNAPKDELDIIQSKYADFNPDQFDLKIFGDSPDDVALPAVQIDRIDYRNIRKAPTTLKVVRDKKVISSEGKAVAEHREAAIEKNIEQSHIRGKFNAPYLEMAQGHSAIHFPFDEIVAAAGFIRGDTVWIVFDSIKNIDLSQVVASSKGLIRDVRKVKLNNGQLILIKLKRPVLFAMEHNDNVWTARIGDMVTAKADMLHLRRKKSAKGRRHVRIAVQRTGHVYWLRDDAIGDRVGIVTVYPPVVQLGKPQQFVEFETFGTAQGIALLPKTDDVEIRVGFQEVVISRYQGLHISDGRVLPERVRSRHKRENDTFGFIDFQKWRRFSEAPFMDQLGGLEVKIARATNEKQKYLAMRDYARFLIANELAAESLGLLKRIVIEQPVRQNEAEIRVMQAAASVMMRRPEDAIKALALGVLHNNDHAALWRGMASGMLAKWSDALREMRRGEDALGLYPHLQRARFIQAAAEAAFNLKNYTLMERFLHKLRNDVGVAEIDLKSRLLYAQYLSNVGKARDAMDIYQAIAGSDVAPLSARAKVGLLNLKLDEKQIDAREAITQLEGLQLMWRGDQTELEMLALLSHLYAESGNYRQAFLNMKQAVLAFPADKTALEIQDDMAKVFKSLFLLNKKTNLRPIESLSLFYDFKELTPVGRAGDDMIRILADRLIDVDLLDHAGELLEHQVMHRVHGVARSQVAAKLAMVHLMNRKPHMALRTIGSTRQPNLPDHVKKARDILEARSLGEMGRVDGAIDILNRMKGPEIERLKADAYWNAQQWRKAGEQLEKILGTSWNDAKSLAPYQRKDVLRAAISYSLAEDSFALSRLRKKYYNKMVRSKDANSFIVVTKPVKGDGKAYKQLAKEIASINTLDAFMKQYREHYQKSLSKTTSRGPSNQDDG